MTLEALRAGGGPSMAIIERFSRAYQRFVILERPAGSFATRRRRGLRSRIARGLGVCALGALAGGCSTLSTYMPVVEQFGVYKLDINQGNYLSQDMVDKLKVGQTRQQVRTVLGTPLLVNAFRNDRWDYVYEYKRQGRALEHRAFTVYFVDDKLARWEGDEMPPSVADLNRAADAKALPPGHTADDKGILSWFYDLFRK
jgi:outer membrane protein assembly factor BamE